MKKFLHYVSQLLIASGLLLFSSHFAMAAQIPLRGVVEGFYGTPWQQPERLDILKFCHEVGFNAYIYAPKDDLYHRAKWREPYPTAKLSELKTLIDAASEQKVQFIFAVSPGLDLHFTDEAGKQDRAAMLAKFTTMYQLGVRQFAIFFDDIKDKNGRGQAEFVNYLNTEFVKKHADIAPLIVVPTEYFYADMQSDGVLKEYSRDFSQSLQPDILVLYTGNGVVSDGLSDADYQQAVKVYGHELGIWWNYPVTDYMENKLALGAVEKLPQQTAPAIFFNPMKYEALSKIALATGAAYANNTASYDANQAWQTALTNQYGDLAELMMMFANQSMHLENNWAKVGAPDAADFAELIKNYWQASNNAEKQVAAQRLLEKNSDLLAAITRLQNELPVNVLQECQAQLNQLQRICSAVEYGLTAIEKGDLTSQQKFVDVYREIKKHDKDAAISNEVLRKLVDDIAAKVR